MPLLAPAFRDKQELTHCQMRCHVAIQVGEMGKTSRTSIDVPDAFFQAETEDAFDVFSDCVDERVSSALAQYVHRTDRSDAAIYIKPGAYSAQKDLLKFTASNYTAMIAHAKANYDKRKKTTGPFVCEFVVYVVKASVLGTSARRATTANLQSAGVAVDAFLQANPDPTVGEITRAHWIISQARQPESAPVVLPESATFRQMQYIDSLRAADPVPSTGDAYSNVTVRLNGSRDMVLSVNITELRAALGLPNHNLLLEGIFNAFAPPAMPVDDVEDEEHKSDDGDDL